MNIRINGEAYPIPQENQFNITAALALYFSTPQQSTFAVALNGNFVGKDAYQQTMLKNGDSVDILQPIQGG